MKQIILFSTILFNAGNCTSDTFRQYQGYIYQADVPMANVAVFEQDDPANKTVTDKQGFFTLKKKADAVSMFLMVSKDNTIIDSIQVIRTSGGEQMNYYFTEGRTDTLFVQKR